MDLPVLGPMWGGPSGWSETAAGPAETGYLVTQGAGPGVPRPGQTRLPFPGWHKRGLCLLSASAAESVGEGGSFPVVRIEQRNTLQSMQIAAYPIVQVSKRSSAALSSVPTLYPRGGLCC